MMGLRKYTRWCAPGYRAGFAQVSGLAALFCFGMSLQGGIAPCPNTVGQNAAYPSGNYVCRETDNLWFGFTDAGAVTPGDSALPVGTIFHIDNVGPNDLAITLEPGGTATFLTGATYAWSFFVTEDSFGNMPLVGADSDYGAQGTQPTLITRVEAVTVDSFNADGTANTTLGSLLGTLTNTNGSLIRMDTGPVNGLKFTNTLTGIGANTTIQSLSNTVQEAPEPRSGIEAGVCVCLLIGLRAKRRRLSR